MKNLIARTAMTFAAATLAFAPIAAQANTRAGDSTTVYSQGAVSQPGTARSADGEDLAGTGIGALIAIFATLIVTGGIIILIDDDDDQSPGT
ncbi:hypothetical protein [Erythrobacter sp. MTPC3]|uniref:hypothetical protein n=1 Tax=Erythrobacter sp. MTPC3 TaxID=3056564 RepID=UPI0036F332F9